MSNSGVPMLTDYGISCSPNQFGAASKVDAIKGLEGTTPWLAYELLGIAEEKDCITQVSCTQASDVWAFGMIVYVSNYVLSDPLAIYPNLCHVGANFRPGTIRTYHRRTSRANSLENSACYS